MAIRITRNYKLADLSAYQGLLPNPDFGWHEASLASKPFWDEDPDLKVLEGTVNLASVGRDLGRIGGRCPDDFRRTSPLTKQRRNGPAAFGGWRVAADAVRP